MSWERPVLDPPTPFVRRDLRSPMLRKTVGGRVGGIEHSLSVIPETRVNAFASVVSQATVGDEVIDTLSNATIVQDFFIDLGINVDALPKPLRFSSSNENVATVDQAGHVTHVAAGEAIITIECSDRYIKIEVPITTTETGGGTSTRFNSLVAGSLRAHLAAQVDTRIAGKNPSTAKPLYFSFPSNSNYADAGELRGNVDEFIRNSNFWAADVSNITCISPSFIAAGESTHRRSPTGTLISPYHYISVAHSNFNPPVGSTLYFVGLDGSLYGSEVLGDSPVPNSDFQVGILDTPMPAAVEPAKVFPDSVYDQLFSNHLERVPALLLDQQEHGMIHTVNNNVALQGFKIPPAESIYHGYVDQGADNRIWDSAGIELGDSGNPGFVIHNGKLVLLTCMSAGHGGGGSSITLRTTEIQSTMNSLSTTHSKPQQNLNYATL